MSDQYIVLDTPEQIDMYRLLALKAALKLKVNHGIIAARGASLIRVAKYYGFTGRTNKAALVFVEALVSEKLPEDVREGLVVEALLVQKRRKVEDAKEEE